MPLIAPVRASHDPYESETKRDETERNETKRYDTKRYDTKGQLIGVSLRGGWRRVSFRLSAAIEISLPYLAPFVPAAAQAARARPAPARPRRRQRIDTRRLNRSQIGGHCRGLRRSHVRPATGARAGRRRLCKI